MTTLSTSCEQQPTSSSSLSNANPAITTTAEADKRNWKLLIDPQLKKGLQKLYRFDGNCPSSHGHRNLAFVITSTTDPRDRPRKLEQPDVQVPPFQIDANYVGLPPQREVGIFGLNDNINRSFLLELCKKCGSVEDVVLYYHPKTKKHLGIAHAVFERARQALDFVERYNETAVMGAKIQCFIDPYVDKVSNRYEEQTQVPVPTPNHLKALDPADLLQRRASLHKQQPSTSYVPVEDSRQSSLVSSSSRSSFPAATASAAVKTSESSKPSTILPPPPVIPDWIAAIAVETARKAAADELSLLQAAPLMLQEETAPADPAPSNALIQALPASSQDHNLSVHSSVPSAINAGVSAGTERRLHAVDDEDNVRRSTSGKRHRSSSSSSSSLSDSSDPGQHRPKYVEVEEEYYRRRRDPNGALNDYYRVKKYCERETERRKNNRQQPESSTGEPSTVMQTPDFVRDIDRKVQRMKHRSGSTSSNSVSPVPKRYSHHKDHSKTASRSRSGGTRRSAEKQEQRPSSRRSNDNRDHSKRSSTRPQHHSKAKRPRHSSPTIVGPSRHRWSSSSSDTAVDEDSPRKRRSDRRSSSSKRPRTPPIKSRHCSGDSASRRKKDSSIDKQKQSSTAVDTPQMAETKCTSSMIGVRQRPSRFDRPAPVTQQPMATTAPIVPPLPPEILGFMNSPNTGEMSRTTMNLHSRMQSMNFLSTNKATNPNAGSALGIRPASVHHSPSLLSSSVAPPPSTAWSIPKGPVGPMELSNMDLVKNSQKPSFIPARPPPMSCQPPPPPSSSWSMLQNMSRGPPPPRFPPQNMIYFPPCPPVRMPAAPSSYRLPSDAVGIPSKTGFAQRKNTENNGNFTMKPPQKPLTELERYCMRTRNMLTNEIRQVLTNDIQKRLIEAVAFRRMDSWWTEKKPLLESKANNEKNNDTVREEQLRLVTDRIRPLWTSPHKQSNDDVVNSAQSAASQAASATLRQLFADTPADNEDTTELCGLPGFGMRAAMPKMPSFRKKIDLSRSSNCSDDEGKESTAAAQEDLLIGAQPLSDDDETSSSRSVKDHSDSESAEDESENDDNESIGHISSLTNGCSPIAVTDDDEDDDRVTKRLDGVKVSDFEEDEDDDEDTADAPPAPNSYETDADLSLESVREATPSDLHKTIAGPIEEPMSAQSPFKIERDEQALAALSKPTKDVAAAAIVTETTPETAIVADAAGSSSTIDIFFHGKGFDEVEWSETMTTAQAGYTPQIHDHCYWRPSCPSFEPIVLLERLPEPLAKPSPIKKKSQKPKQPRISPSTLWSPPIDLSIENERMQRASEKRASIRFQERTIEEAEILLNGFAKIGFDDEDLHFLRISFEDLQTSSNSPWFRPLNWITPPVVPAPDETEINLATTRRRTKQMKGGAVEERNANQTGCARTEGYHRLSHKQKRSMIRRTDAAFAKTESQSQADITAARHQVQAGREARSMQRRLLTTLGEVESDLLKVNQLKYRKKMIKFARSQIHGWGLYALETIAPDEMIIEYVGQKIRCNVADTRERRYERRGIGSSYLFRIDNEQVIDATQMGNFARFINHSCQPNCYAKIVTVEGDKRIVIYSKSTIHKGEEITYDYKFPVEEQKIDCLCGAPTCRGTLN